MPEPSPERQTVLAIRRAWQEAADLALLISDEMEMGRLPNQDGADAIRMFAGLLSSAKHLS